MRQYVFHDAHFRFRDVTVSIRCLLYCATCLRIIFFFCNRVSVFGSPMCFHMRRATMQTSPHKCVVPSVLYLLGLGVSPMLWIVQYGKKYDFNLPFRFRVAQASAVQVEGSLPHRQEHGLLHHPPWGQPAQQPSLH
jgi:hypothetical protein